MYSYYIKETKNTFNINKDTSPWAKLHCMHKDIHVWLHTANVTLIVKMC